MDKIKLAAGIASAIMAGISAYTFFNMPVSAACPQAAKIECLGRLRTADEIADINALSQMLYGEARGVKSTTNQAACVWVVLNRVDDDRWPDNVIDVLSQPWQFGGYDECYPVTDELRELAADVYDRWQAEHDGEEDVGRVIPDDYYFWCGSKRGVCNYFRKEFDSQELWQFTWASPYED